MTRREEQQCIYPGFIINLTLGIFRGKPFNFCKKGSEIVLDRNFNSSMTPMSLVHESKLVRSMCWISILSSVKGMIKHFCTAYGNEVKMR